MENAYLNALKSKEIKDIKIAPSKRRQAMIKQQGKCAKCKKDITPVYSKFVKEGEEYIVICSDCAIEIPKR